MKSLFTLSILALASTAALAQAYPGDKPVTLVVPFAAGGPTDKVARDLGDVLRKQLNQPVIIDRMLLNRPVQITSPTWMTMKPTISPAEMKCSVRADCRPPMMSRRTPPMALKPGDIDRPVISISGRVRDRGTRTGAIQWRMTTPLEVARSCSYSEAFMNCLPRR